MQATTPSDPNPFKFPLFSQSLDYYNASLAWGVIYSSVLDYPMYRAHLKGQPIAEGNDPAHLILDVVEHIVALERLKGNHVRNSRIFAA